MPETVSTGEVAHTIGHPHSPHTKASRRAELIEIAEAILLAIVAIATAWGGYQTGLFDGRQAHLYGLSSKYRAGENRAADLSGQQKLYDSTTFGFWFSAKARGDQTEASLFERRFRLEYRPAFAAWLRTDPLHNPNAPAAPLLMPQYHNAAAERAAAYDRKASSAFEDGTKARETGDKYLRATVLLATVLFLTALAQKFKIEKVRVGLLLVSAILLVIGVSHILTYPHA
jgi:hypothetical protein